MSVLQLCQNLIYFFKLIWFFWCFPKYSFSSLQFSEQSNSREAINQRWRNNQLHLSFRNEINNIAIVRSSRIFRSCRLYRNVDVWLTDECHDASCCRWNRPLGFSYRCNYWWLSRMANKRIPLQSIVIIKILPWLHRITHEIDYLI